MTYYPTCDHCRAILTAGGIVCELCGERRAQFINDEDDYLDVRNKAIREGWLFNYNGKWEYALCSECQEGRTK